MRTLPMKQSKVLYSELSYKLMGILFDVHTGLGNRYQEKHYQRAVETKFKQANIRYRREVKTEVSFEGEKIGDFFLDFLIDERIVLEIKTIVKITHNEVKQVLRYLEATGLHLAIIANFRPNRLEYKRVVL